jgi:hypothetical protein
MIRLTVMYNLPDGASEEEFLHWRLGEHQEANASMVGVIRTDFARIDETLPRGAVPPYRFMTIAEWADRESFEKAFYGSESQDSLEEDLKKIKDPVFLVSEILIEAKNG